MVVRLAIAPLTGHPYDMALWADYQRIFYGSGILDFKYFPTLPPLYYFQLATYSFYTILRIGGLQDPLLFYHPTYAIEGIFLKLPMIIADMGVFFLFVRSGKILPAVLYYLNPFVIYLSAAWGTYDSLMIVFLVAGFVALERDNKRLATVAFTISGLVKLFGLIPLALMALENVGRRRFKDLLLQIAIVSSAFSVIFAPVILQGGLPTFFSGFLRFIGISTAQSSGWNIVSAFLGKEFSVSPFIWIAYLSIPIIFILRLRKPSPLFLSALQSTLIGAILLNIFSQAEPQWLAWPISLALFYASVTGRQGLSYYAYSFGAIATFLVMTLTQGTGYILFGVLGSANLGPLEGFVGSLPVYATTTLSLLLLMIGYLVAKPIKFKFEVLVLVVIIYVQAYFWFSIVGIQSL